MVDQPALRVVHTADLEAPVRAEAQRLLHDAFRVDWSDQDWEHALGGLHVLLHEDERLIGHAALVQRHLLHRGRALRTGYVEAVGVALDRRGRGYGHLLMAAVEDRVRRAYDLGALSATEDGRGLYRSRGWRPWRGPTGVLTPDGPRRTPDDDGAVHVLATAIELDLDAELTCDWRDGDVW
jgi:aminoglycoside 2'-N-acetyltransferase I